MPTQTPVENCPELHKVAMSEGVPENHAPYVVSAILRELTVAQCRQLIEEKEAEATEQAKTEETAARRRASRRG